MKTLFIKIFKHRILTVCILLVTTVLAFVMCNDKGSSGPAASSAENTCDCGVLTPVHFGPAIPGDNKLVTGQPQANCFAWAEFVALNWPADSTAPFGKPGDTNPVQWETYMTREELMTPDGTPPPKWGNPLKASPEMAGLLRSEPPGTKLLFHTSKFNGAGPKDKLNEQGEAAPFGQPNWLGAQNGTNIWYEVLVNEDEYNYIVENKFYNADSQYNYVVDQNKRIDLPRGDAHRSGAMELKASWLEVTDPQNERWKRYKLSKAVLIDAQNKSTRKATVALIGLHILHKTASQPTWFWTTFEHVDNVPGNAGSAATYNLYNPAPKVQYVKVPGNCGDNPNKADSTYKVDTIPNVPPPYYLCNGAGPVPIQVTRRIPIDAEATATNNLLQNYIRTNYPGSVWANYQLVNVIWSTTPQTVQNNLTPQLLASMQPMIPLANSAAETYIQTAACTYCHQDAFIAASSKSQSNFKYASDFSFIFKFANYKKK